MFAIVNREIPCNVLYSPCYMLYILWSILLFDVLFETFIINFLYSSYVLCLENPKCYLIIFYIQFYKKSDIIIIYYKIIIPYYMNNKLNKKHTS